MASTVADCDRMIPLQICNKTLQIGYRLYWDPFNIGLMEAMKTRNSVSSLACKVTSPTTKD